MRVHTVREVDLIDSTEIQAVERACAAMPPTSEVAQAVRDVLAGLRWTAANPDSALVVTVDRVATG